MAIEITEFADVSISVSPTGVSEGNFGILGFLAVDAAGQAKAGKDVPSAERTRSYTSLESVALDWEATSEVYLAASAFYGQTPTPRDFVVLMNYVDDTAAQVVGGTHAVLADIVAVGATAAIAMDVDGTTIDTTVDVSGAASLAAIAALVETALATGEAGTTCTYTCLLYTSPSPRDS